ncbi:MAG: phenylalanine--tRNA ligase subunit alpha, partial [Deltaproteobacteria bacterium]
MREQLEQLRNEALEAIASAADEEELQGIRVRLLGRKGELTALMKGLGALSPEERPSVGQLVNSVRDDIESTLAVALSTELERVKNERLQSERIDVTLPGR